MDLVKTGRFISALRKKKDMTQKDLAKKLGVTDKAVSRWETGKGFPDVSLLITLAGEMGVSVSELITGEMNKINGEREAEILKKMDNSIISALDYSQRLMNEKLKKELPNIFIIGAFVGAVSVLIYYFA
jgi:transcriptional regulator with XRE-family HTH domain